VARGGGYGVIFERGVCGVGAYKIAKLDGGRLEIDCIN